MLPRIVSNLKLGSLATSAWSAAHSLHHGMSKGCVDHRGCIIKTAFWSEWSADWKARSRCRGNSVSTWITWGASKMPKRLGCLTRSRKHALCDSFYPRARDKKHFASQMNALTRAISFSLFPSWRLCYFHLTRRRVFRMIKTQKIYGPSYCFPCHRTMTQETIALGALNSLFLRSDTCSVECVL